MSQHRVNALIGQSGGPTSVINNSLLGVIEGCRQHEAIDRVYGMRFGIEGFMQQMIFDLSGQPSDVLEGLRVTPSSALGSSRHKLTDADLPKIRDLLAKHNIGYLFMIGGNDTMDTIHRIEAYCREHDHELIGVGIPKTVDNDLPGTDHTPGFPSAARCNALSVMQAGWLARDMQRVDSFVVYQTIGRDAGWLAAAAAMARRDDDDAPHLIYCPERRFNADQMLEDAKAAIDRHGWVSIVVSEGLRYEDGTPVSASRTQDKFGNVEFGAMGGASVGLNVHRMLSDRLGVRGEFQITESLIMSAADRAVELDRQEAYQCGVEGVQLAKRGESGFMVSMNRTSNDPYTIAYEKLPLGEVALQTKEMPADFINERGNNVTEKCLAYLRPLVGPMPAYVRLADRFIEPVE